MWLKLLKFKKHNNLLNKLKLNRQIISNFLLMMSKCLNKNGLKGQNHHKNPPKLENNHQSLNSKVILFFSSLTKNANKAIEDRFSIK